MDFVNPRAVPLSKIEVLHLLRGLEADHFASQKSERVFYLSGPVPHGQLSAVVIAVRSWRPKVSQGTDTAQSS